MPGPLLYPYQRRWLEDQARFKAGMFARQTGKTFTTTLELVLDCQMAQAAGKRERWVILSRGERQAKEAMDEGVRRHAQALGAVIRASEFTFRGDATYKALEAEWPGGSKVTALPANPDTARGYSANVFLDEFAIHKDSREIWKALFPVISAGHRLRVTSTPQGKGNKFYELMTDPGLDGTWSRHIVDIYQAVRDGLPRDVDELKRGLADPDAWAQEFELEWLDEASAWLPFDLINACEHPAAGDPNAYQDGPCFVGMDFAARGDFTVLWVLEQIGDVLWARERIEMKRATFAAQLAELDRLMTRYRVVRAALDQTGMGESPTQDAQRRHGASRIAGVLFTAPAKLDMATRLKDRMEDRRLRLPEGDALLRSDLHSVQRVAGPTGIPRLIAEREGGSHADRFWSLALAVAAAGDAAGPMEWTPIAPAERGPWRAESASAQRTRPARDFRGHGW